jgi:CheY-like chemotaxis protein
MKLIELSLVHGGVERHRGSIRSEGPGFGTGSGACLPPAGGQGVDAAEGSSPPLVERQQRVVLIEDNDDVREALRTILELHGHVVEDASDGQAGIERTIAFAPDVVFIDIGLPDLDGFEVARRLAAAYDGRRPHLVAMSGYTSAEDRELVIEAGFDVQLVKPVHLTDLTRVLEQVPPRPGSYRLRLG